MEMMKRKAHATFIAFTIAAGSAGLTTVHAQQKFPTKPLRLVVAFTPGGTTDILARMVAPGMSETFGQPIVIENRPGAGGILAMKPRTSASREAVLRKTPKMSDSACSATESSFAPAVIVTAMPRRVAEGTSTAS